MMTIWPMLAKEKQNTEGHGADEDDREQFLPFFRSVVAKESNDTNMPLRWHGIGQKGKNTKDLHESAVGRIRPRKNVIEVINRMLRKTQGTCMKAPWDASDHART